MKLIIGLGNPGDKYESTRHNFGFTIIDQFLKKVEPVSKSNWKTENKFKSDINIFEYKPKKGKPIKVILAKPQTYMNNSGVAVGLISKYYKIKPEDIWIIHDELDLPLGFMKIKQGGSAAGHKGIESIIKSISSDKFWRFRMGIGEEKSRQKNGKSKFKKVENFVLKGFRNNDKGTTKNMIKRGVRAIQTGLEKDLTSAMNQFNTK